jgi:putative PIG3 family NAD(P)H quinone oxidoreductase
MKAVIADGTGGPDVLRIAECPDPVVGRGEVLIAVAATALNRADLLQRRGLYPAPPGASPLLGLECAGTVLELGEGSETIAVSDRVMVLLAGGGYAQRVTAPAALLMPVPPGLSFEQAAAIPEAFLTADEALFELGKLQAGESVLIHAAAGGVGSAAVQLARHASATVIATCGSAEKAAAVRELGADHVIDYKQQDFEAAVSEITAGRGVDVIVDVVGAAYWEKHARCLAHGGRSIVMGLLGGSKANVDFGLLLRKRAQLLGLVMRTRPLTEKVALSRRFVRKWLPLFSDGRLVPLIDSIVPLADVSAAHSRMEANANIGKIVLRVD